VRVLLFVKKKEKIGAKTVIRQRNGGHVSVRNLIHKS